MEDFQPAIVHYELALSLVQSGKEKDSPLIKEFQQSLKQVRIRAAAYEMKRPDRTFTNLSKGVREGEPALRDDGTQAMFRIIKSNSR